MRNQNTQSRLQALKKLLLSERASTQDELREALEKLDFEVNQSTVSRDLRRLGAMKLLDPTGRTVYRLSEVLAPDMAPLPTDLPGLVTHVAHNGSMIVIRTSPGSASLVARQVDRLGADEVLGTIAGDDTVFVAPTDIKRIERLKKNLLVLLTNS